MQRRREIAADLKGLRRFFWPALFWNFFVWRARVAGMRILLWAVAIGALVYACSQIEPITPQQRAADLRARRDRGEMVEVALIAGGSLVCDPADRALGWRPQAGGRIAALNAPGHVRGEFDPDWGVLSPETRANISSDTLEDLKKRAESLC